MTGSSIVSRSTAREALGSIAPGLSQRDVVCRDGGIRFYGSDKLRKISDAQLKEAST
jgi:hypothetical protein